MYEGSITDVQGLLLGHARVEDEMRGLSVIICPQGTRASVDVRGGAPGTRETDLLDPLNAVQEIDAIFLSGGSAYGLAAGQGIMEELERRGRGLDVGTCRVPIVSGAVIFDLIHGDVNKRPGEKEGVEAVKSASKDRRQGLLGAGLGATVGKYAGLDFAMKSGLGMASIKMGDLVVSALVVINAFGDIYDLRGNIIGGAYDRKKGEFLDYRKFVKKERAENLIGQNTSLGIVATNASFDKAELKKIASMAHNGFARTIFPVHTMNDGDTIFSLSTGKIKSDLSLVGSLASDAIAKSVINSLEVESSLGFPGRLDM